MPGFFGYSLPRARDFALDFGFVVLVIGVYFLARGLAPTRIVVAEFGCMRRWTDCGAYLTDVINSVDARGGHWAFYSFREDVWEGMDYELPATVKPGQYYWLAEQHKLDKLPRNGPLMQILREKMQH